MSSEINEIKALAIETLKSVCNDQDANPAARAAAARSLAEICALIGRNSVADGMATKGLTEMTGAELDAEIKRLSSQK